MAADPAGSVGGVSRGPLIEAVRSGPSRVVGVTAPAGYGKTAFLAQWAGSDPRAVVTVALDRSDDGMDRLLAVIAAAFAESLIVPEVAEAVSDAASWGTAARRMAAALRACPRPFVLLVDDLHVVQVPSGLLLLQSLAAAIPSGSQLVTTSRHTQAHLPRLRAAGAVVELTQDHLAFGPKDARDVFSAAGVKLAAHEADRLVQATEGWPAGIALTLHGVREGHASPADVSGDHRWVADYFESEVLGPLPDHLQEFLRRSAVLDRLSGELCDAVLDRSDSAASLHELESTTRFITPEGPGRRSYRAHRLFREFLLGELRREDALIVRDLHRRAAGWYESHGSPMLAVDHLLETDDEVGTVRLVEATASDAWLSGDVGTLQRWLSTLGTQRISARPRLAVLQGWIAAMTGRPVVAERWLAFLEDVVADPAREESVRLASEVAMLRSAMSPDGPARALVDALVALGRQGRWSDRRVPALALCGEAHLALGETDNAIVCFERATHEGHEHGRHDLVMSSRASLAWIAMDRGDWGEGADHVSASLTALEASRHLPQPSTMLAHAASARSLLHRGDLPAAARALDDATQSRGVSTHARPFPAVKGRIGVAKLLWSLGDHAGARTLLRELQDVLRERPDVGVLRDELDEFIALARSGGASTSRESVTAPLTPAELRVLPYLQTHLTIAEIGERLFVSRNTVNTEIASIYRKLGASSRGSAVDRARVLGLLGH